MKRKVTQMDRDGENRHSDEKRWRGSPLRWMDMVRMATQPGSNGKKGHGDGEERTAAEFESVMRTRSHSPY